MIYLDNSATTKLDDRVREAMLPYFIEEYGNASSIYDLGRHARIALEEARTTVANAIGAEESEVAASCQVRRQRERRQDAEEVRAAGEAVHRPYGKSLATVNVRRLDVRT